MYKILANCAEKFSPSKPYSFSSIYTVILKLDLKKYSLFSISFSQLQSQKVKKVKADSYINPNLSATIITTSDNIAIAAQIKINLINQYGLVTINPPRRISLPQLIQNGAVSEIRARQSGHEPRGTIKSSFLNKINHIRFWDMTQAQITFALYGQKYRHV